MDGGHANPLRFTRDQLMASHDYAQPHDAVGYRLHGGFDGDGVYVSPRTLNRWPAVRAWASALESRGWPLIDATSTLLKLPNYPTAAQERMLLQAGFGQGLWNSLTVTGVIEARGRALVDFAPPDMQKLIVEDIADSATGHLRLGLLEAHGMDEGGGDPRTPDRGAHDAMWFAARDLVFGKDAYPLPPIPDSISRPVTTEREMPQIAPPYEGLIKMLMNVLMIEVRAESFFAFCCDVFRDPAVFRDRRSEAEQAAVLVERIRTDEAVHVAYLQTVVSELRSFTFRTVEGTEIAGKAIVDPIWADMVDWHGRREREAGRLRSRADIELQLSERLGGIEARNFISRFDALESQSAELA